MRIKQKIYSTKKQQNNSLDNVYSKNPRFKIQNIMKTKVIQLSQKCLVTKSYLEYSQEQQHVGKKQKVRKICGIKYKDSNRNSNTRYDLQQGASQNMNKKYLKNHHTHINIQTIDLIKQEISKTLVKDLLSLKNMEQSFIAPKKRYSQRKRLFPSKRRNFTINYNQCYNLAQQRCSIQHAVKLNPQQSDIANKLDIFDSSRNKNISPLINFLKKKQLIERYVNGVSPSVSYTPNKYKKINDQNMLKKNYQSYRQKTKQVQKNRETMFSPWQMQKNGRVSQHQQDHDLLKYFK